MNLEENKTSASEKKIYGSFYLNDSEFAISVVHVQEVVNSPQTFTSLPLAPPYLKGLFNLRGAVIPVVDLRSLLNMPDVSSSSSENQKVAILELNGTYIGLLFDRTGEIFRSTDEERSDFNDESINAVVSGVFKKESGQRIVQILNVTKLFKLQNVPKDTGKNQRSNLARKRGQRKQCISFKVGPAKCAMGISEIQEILKIDKVSESALSVGYCIGTIDLRGMTVPLVDFAALLGYRETDRSDGATQGDRRVVVMRLEKELFGLMVDAVDSIVSYFPDELLAFPVIEQSRGDMFIGCITNTNQSDILLLDHQKILTNTEVTEITHGHSKLYRSNATGPAEKESKGGGRKTYITFMIANSYAIGINDVKEIIDYPNSLLQPPGLPHYFRGILNLRGELVTIVDARSMYGTESEENSKAQGKVIIFKRNDTHFGLIVDAVESIISFTEKDKIRLPEMLYKTGSSGSITEDIAEAVEVTNNAGEKRSLLVLSADSIATRISKTLAAA